MSVRSSRPGESTDVQYDPFRSSRGLGQTWPVRSNFDLDLSKSIYIWFDASWRDKHDGIKIVALLLKLKILSSKNRFGFWKILAFWPLETSILTWAKKWSKWFRNYFSRAAERCLSFFSTATRSRDHGEGGVQTPPSQQAVENPEAQLGAWISPY